MGADYRQFEKQHHFFNQHYQVISISLRGHGNSGTPISSSKAAFSLKTMSEDIIALLDILKIKQVHYVGNSLGGNIAYELLKNAPSRILTLSTFGTTAILKKSKIEVLFLKTIYKLLSQRQIAYLSKLAGQSNYAKKDDLQNDLRSQ